MSLLVISGFVFVLSIIAFSIKIWTNQLKLRQIIEHFDFNTNKPWYHSHCLSIILMISLLHPIVFYQQHPLVTFSFATLVILVQKLFISVVLLINTKNIN